MRRAFRIDPHNLHHYRLQSDVQPHIRSLIGKYQYDLQHRGRVQDEAFMLAALSYLTGDHASAQWAIDRAERDGDRSRSFRNLKGFIHESYSLR